MPGSGEKVFSNEGWKIRTATGPIMGDKDTDEYRRVLSALTLPEMVFHLNRVELIHEATGTVICFNALDALAGWKQENLPPLQVRVAEEWRRAREHEIKQQKAVQLTYDWTFTTPYTCTVVQPTVGSSRPAAPPRSAPDYVMGPAPGLTASHSAPLPAGTVTPGHNPSTMAHAYSAAPSSTTTITTMPPPAAIATLPMAQGSGQKGQSVTSADGGDSQGGSGLSWQPTADVIDRGLLMERDPILFYEELPLYESDLDDNGVCALTVKLRVMPRCWLVLLRLWVRVDGSMVRLRETRLFCRHDKLEKRFEVLQEVKHCEGHFSELRKRGAPDEGPAYADADAASQVFQAVAPVGLTLLQTRKLVLPSA